MRYTWGMFILHWRQGVTRIYFAEDFDAQVWPGDIVLRGDERAALMAVLGATLGA